MYNHTRWSNVLRRPLSRVARKRGAWGSVALTIALLPIWWLLGIEQMVYPFILLGIAIETFARRRRIRLEVFLVLGILLLGWDAVSATQISEPLRYFSFAHSFGATVAGVVAVIVLQQVKPERSDVKLFAFLMVATVSLASLAGLLGVIGAWRPNLHSLVGHLLPQNVAESDTGRLIAVRTVGARAWFLGHTYFRASGTFLYGNMLAVAAAVAIVWMVYLWRVETGLRRIAALALALPVVAVLPFTTSRLTIGALVIGACFMLFLKLSMRVRILVFASSIAALGAVALVLNHQFFTFLHDIIFARGAGSPTHRLQIYSATILGFLQRPIIGWGTVRSTIPGIPYPAGSHSYVLGEAYKHGLGGLSLLIAFAALMWRRARRIRCDPALRDAATWLVAELVIISLGTSFDLDASVMLICSASLGMTAAAAVVPPRRIAKGLRG